MAHYRTMFDTGRFLGSWHLPSDRDSVVEMESVTGGVLENGTVKTKKPLVKMRGKTLLLALNKTNAKVIAKLYGADVSKWVGQPIALYVGQTRDPDGGGQIACIRVRPTRPDAAAVKDSGKIDESRKPEQAE